MIRVGSYVGRWGFGEFLLGALALLLGLNLVGAWIALFYFGIPLNEMFSFVSADGHCLSEFSGLGVHCFGDYGNTINVGNRSAPWSDAYPMPYPAIGLLIFEPFDWLGQMTGDWRFGLYAYMILLVSAVVSIGIYAGWRYQDSRRLSTLTLISLAPVPALAVLDRGNSLAFVLPILLGMFLTLSTRNYFALSGLIVLAALVKPTFLIFALALVAARKWKIFSLTVVVALTLHLSAFLAFGGNPVKNVTEFLADANEYGKWVSLNPGSQNISITQGLIDGSFWLQRVAKLGGSIGYFVSTFPSVVLICMSVISLVLLLLVGKRMTSFEVVLLLLVPAFLGPGLTWPYYASFAIVVAAVLIRPPGAMSCRLSESHPVRLSLRPTALPSSLVVLYATVFATLITLAQVPIPIRVLTRLVGVDSGYSISHALIPLAWLGVWLLLIAHALRRWKESSPDSGGGSSESVLDSSQSMAK